MFRYTGNASQCLLHCSKPVVASTGRIACNNVAVRYAATDNQSKPAEAKPEKKSMISDGLLQLLGPRRRKTRYDSKFLGSAALTEAFPAIPRKPAPDSGPFATYSGRTKTVNDGNVGGAFRELNSTLRQNFVARDYRIQKFYEKPSNKRVRLNRVRHRKRFLNGVKRLVGLVKEQRKYL